MADREAFGEICRRVCEERGWNLQPNGVEVRFADGRHQVVELEFFQWKREDLVRFYSTIGSVERLSPVRLTVALRINSELAHGALAVKGDDLVMTETLLLADADAGELEASIEYLAETADYYEKSLFQTDTY